MLVRPNTASRVAARSAFTLLEVLIVVAILVVLASVSSIYVFKFLHDAKVDAEQEVGAVGLGPVAVVGEHVVGSVAVAHDPGEALDRLVVPRRGDPVHRSGAERRAGGLASRHAHA